MQALLDILVIVLYVLMACISARCGRDRETDAALRGESHDVDTASHHSRLLRGGRQAPSVLQVRELSSVWATEREIEHAAAGGT